MTSLPFVGYVFGPIRCRHAAIGAQIIGFHERLSALPDITLEAISKKPSWWSKLMERRLIGQIPALGAKFNYSK